MIIMIIFIMIIIIIIDVFKGNFAFLLRILDYCK